MKEKLLLFGLNEIQEKAIQAKFGERADIEIAEVYTDLIAIPAAAVVVNPSGMSEKEMAAFNEVFEHDFDTSIIMVETVMPEMNFLYVKENTPKTLADAIDEIDERLSLPDTLKDAKAHLITELENISNIIEGDPEFGLRDKIHTIINNYLIYEKLNRLMLQNRNLYIRTRYPYRVVLNSVFDALLLSQELISEGEVTDSEDGRFYSDKWVISLASNIREKFEFTVKLNKSD